MSVKVKVMKREYFRSLGGSVVFMSESSAIKFSKQGIVKIIDDSFKSNPETDGEVGDGSLVDPEKMTDDKANLDGVPEETKELFPNIDKKEETKEE